MPLSAVIISYLTIYLFWKMYGWRSWVLADLLLTTVILGLGIYYVVSSTPEPTVVTQTAIVSSVAGLALFCYCFTDPSAPH